MHSKVIRTRLEDEAVVSMQVGVMIAEGDLDYSHHAERAWREGALRQLADLLWRARARSRVLAPAYAAVAQVISLDA